MNISNERLGIPRVDVSFIVDALKTLVKLESEWIPDKQGTSLYIRPFIIATDPFLGVRPSNTYKFIIILSPVGAYYAEGINPVKIHVESQYVRSVKGGIGYAKTPGNYAASLKAQIEATQKGFSQVLWLDACEKRYIEEVGSMNVFFKINGEVITPSLDGSILDGITRKSVIQLLQSWDIKVVERKISVDEIYEAGISGALEEAFGTGTAAVISPVGELNINDQALVINQGKVGEISGKVYKTIVDIQTGQISDPFHWVVEVE
jgi:branched-chain amino acid aminotransferase